MTELNSAFIAVSILFFVIGYQSIKLISLGYQGLFKGKCKAFYKLVATRTLFVKTKIVTGKMARIYGVVYLFLGIVILIFLLITSYLFI